MESSSNIEDFDKIKVIGSGSYSTVQLVSRKHDSQFFALKQVKMDKLTQQNKQSALNQIRILASISSPYIISYEGSFYSKNNNSLCILMQYAEQGDLESKINSCAKQHQMMKGLPEKFIWATLIDLLSGLQILHDNGIVHRDMKSANIFFSQGVAKIGDFNVSKLSDAQMYETKTGTPYYTAPEIWKGQAYSKNCDIWSLGCIIYEMCLLLPPFRSTNFPELFISILKGTYDALPLTYSNDLRVLIHMCLQVNPDERPTASQILSHPLVLKNMNQREHRQQSKTMVDLLGPLKCPKILKFINSSLPKPIKSRKELIPQTQNVYHRNHELKKRTVEFAQIRPSINSRKQLSPINHRTNIGTSIKSRISKHVPVGNSLHKTQNHCFIKSSHNIPQNNQSIGRGTSVKHYTCTGSQFRLKSVFRSKKNIDKQNTIN